MPGRGREVEGVPERWGGEEGGGGRRQCVPVCGAVRTYARGTLTLLHLDRSTRAALPPLPPAAARATVARRPPLRAGCNRRSMFRTS